LSTDSFAYLIFLIAALRGVLTGFKYFGHVDVPGDAVSVCLSGDGVEQIAQLLKASALDSLERLHLGLRAHLPMKIVMTFHALRTQGFDAGD
jgi:hypothetical protein